MKVKSNQKDIENKFLYYLNIQKPNESIVTKDIFIENYKADYFIEYNDIKIVIHIIENNYSGLGLISRTPKQKKEDLKIDFRLRELGYFQFRITKKGITKYTLCSVNKIIKKLKELVKLKIKNDRMNLIKNKLDK